VLLSRPPLAGPKADPSDLHVLGTPPAFTLSQDQTLHQECGQAAEAAWLDALTGLNLALVLAPTHSPLVQGAPGLGRGLLIPNHTHPPLGDRSGPGPLLKCRMRRTAEGEKNPEGRVDSLGTVQPTSATVAGLLLPSGSSRLAPVRLCVARGPPGPL
jgi:hypothetical protein